MRYTVALFADEDGYAVGVPGLPGCWSQGATETEALDNIRDAVREYLAAQQQLLAGEGAQFRAIEIETLA
jgi:predicted RNase H-like HicB family nuclease